MQPEFVLVFFGFHPSLGERCGCGVAHGEVPFLLLFLWGGMQHGGKVDGFSALFSVLLADDAFEARRGVEGEGRLQCCAPWMGGVEKELRRWKQRKIVGW